MDTKNRNKTWQGKVTSFLRQSVCEISQLEPKRKMRGLREVKGERERREGRRVEEEKEEEE